ncbi:methyl-accepting chemotaxis protein [Thiohalorhabdus sp. Cl-TMA]|uniref:Methyl-accepting chemotaxis protein n=1 Tax=Thiohalorhabdus methylotrophus TaxID=3242694 RepID=A0ABV4TUP4_9GAMM
MARFRFRLRLPDYRMLTRLGLGAKLALIPALAVIALIGVYAITRLNLAEYQDRVDQAEASGRLEALALQARVAGLSYVRWDQAGKADKRQAALETFQKATGRIGTLAGEKVQALEGEQRLHEQARKILAANRRYTEAFDNLVARRRALAKASRAMGKAATGMQKGAATLDKTQQGRFEVLLQSGEKPETLIKRMNQMGSGQHTIALVRKARMAAKEYMLQGNPANLKTARQSILEVKEITEKTKGQLSRIKDRWRMDSVLEAADAYLARLKDYAAARREGEAQIAVMVEAARSLEKTAAELGRREHTAQLAVRDTLKSSILSVNLVAILLTSLLAFLITRNIRKPIRAVSAAVQHIQANNDFTRRAEVHGNDEISGMARSFNTMVDHQSGLLAGIQEQAAQVATSSEELTATADEISHSARTSSQRVEEVSGSANEVNNVVQEVASNINEVSTTATEATRIAREGINTVEDASGKIDGLKQASDRVEEIMETIQAIAKKTDLLALNAAIEAANAGEHGKGFAVVADEVRKLAEQTSEATYQVNQIISDLQGQSEASVRAMGEVQERMNRVLSHIQRNDETANQIAASAEELAATMSETTENMTHISGNVEQVTGSVTQIESAAQQLGELAASLRASVDQFRIRAE